MELVNMKVSKKAQEEMYEPKSVDAPMYPWGLKLSLDNDQLKKLGIDKLPDVGQKVMVVAVAEVCDRSEYESAEGGARRCMGLQITDISIEKEAAKKDHAKELYGA